MQKEKMSFDLARRCRISQCGTLFLRKIHIRFIGRTKAHDIINTDIRSDNETPGEGIEWKKQQ